MQCIEWKDILFYSLRSASNWVCNVHNAKTNTTNHLPETDNVQYFPNERCGDLNEWKL